VARPLLGNPSHELIKALARSDSAPSLGREADTLLHEIPHRILEMRAEMVEMASCGDFAGAAAMKAKIEKLRETEAGCDGMTTSQLQLLNSQAQHKDDIDRVRQEKIQAIEKDIALKAKDEDYAAASRLQAELAALKTTPELTKSEIAAVAESQQLSVHA